MAGVEHFKRQLDKRLNVKGDYKCITCGCKLQEHKEKLRILAVLVKKYGPLEIEDVEFHKQYPNLDEIEFIRDEMNRKTILRFRESEATDGSSP